MFVAHIKATPFPQKYNNMYCFQIQTVWLTMYEYILISNDETWDPHLYLDYIGYETLCSISLYSSDKWPRHRHLWEGFDSCPSFTGLPLYFPFRSQQSSQALIMDQRSIINEVKVSFTKIKPKYSLTSQGGNHALKNVQIFLKSLFKKFLSSTI